MSNTIDRKVVEMQFDNAQFEKNVKSSMSTLDKLKSSLKFDGFAKGFDDIERRSGKLDFSGMSGALDSVTKGFSLLENVAIGALRRIGERAADAGIQLVKSMSVDNIAAGWSKFEDKTKSVGTLIAQGYDMSTVETQLERLNWFTDETSYSFTEMVSSIAKFTATGKKLPDSVDALMGIANWAALSGQNAETASRAMYQLSQAMGSGVMRKEDYKSIQNMSMDTAEFRQIALDTAIAMGTLKKNVDGTYESIVKGAKASKFTISQFADHLTQDQWFTADVMMEVYRKYGSAVDTIYNYTKEHTELTASEAIAEIKRLGVEIDDFGLKAFKASQEARTWGDTVESVKEAVASGFMKTYEIIFGNYEEATKLWTDLANKFYDAFAQPINDFNELLAEALNNKDIFIEDYLKTLTGSDKTASTIRDVAEKFGFFSEEVKNTALNLADGDEKLANVLTHFTRLNSEVSESTQIVGASSDELIAYVAKLTGASEEQVFRMREIGEEYGYRSTKFVGEVQKTLGKSKKSLLEITSELLSVGKGLDTIESKNVDEFLTTSLGLTSEQTVELRKLSKEYGANSSEVDNYLNSLNNLKNYGYAGLRATKEGIKGILDVTDSLIESTNEWVKGDLAGYIVNLTGASRDSVDVLLDLANAEDKNIEKIDEWALSIANGDENTKELILSLIEMQEETDKMLGRQNLLDAFNNVWDHLSIILGTIKEAFQEVFPPATAESIYDFTKKIKDLTEQLDHSESKLDNLKRTFKGFFSIFRIIGQVVRAATIPIKDLFKRFAGGSGSILDATANLGDWITALADSGKVGEKATEIFTKVSEAVQGIVDFLCDFIDISGTIQSYNNAGGGLAGVFSVIGDKVKVVIDYVLRLISSITGWDVSEVKTKVLGFIDRAKQAIQDFLPTQEEMKKGFENIKEVVSKIIGFFGFGKDSVETDGIEKATEKVSDLSSTVGDATSNISTLGEKLAGFFGKFKGIIETITEVFGSIRDSGVFTGFASTFDKIGKNLGKLDFSNIIGLAKSGALALIGAGIYKIGKNIGSFTDAFSKNGIFGSNSILSANSKDWSTKLKNLALSIALLAASLFLLSKVDADKVWGALGVLTILVVEMVASMAIMDKALKGGGKASVLSMIGFATSILILAKAIEKIASDVPSDRLWAAVGVISILVAVLAGAEALMSVGKASGKLAGAIGAKIFVKAVVELADEIIKLADPKYSKDRIAMAAWVVGGITVVLGVAVAIASIGDTTSILAGGVAALLMTKAIISIAEEIIKLASFDGDIWSALGVVTVIAAVLDIILVTFGRLDKPGAILAGAASTVILATAINMIAIAVSALSLFDQRKVWSATLAITALIAVIGIYTKVISGIPAPYVLAAASALAISGFAILEMAAALSIFSGVIATFSAMAAGDFWKGIGYVVAAITALGLAFAVIAPATLVMIAFSTALLIASAATVVFGVGLTAIAKGLTAMAGAILIFGLAVKVGGKDFINGLGFMIEGFINLIPRIAKAIVGFAVSIGESIVDEMPRIREVLKELVVNGIGIICDSLEASVIPIADTTLTLIIGVLGALVEHAPELVDKLMTLLIEILHGVGEHIEELTEELMTIIIGIINGIGNKLPELIEAGANLIKNLIEGIIKALKDFKIENVDDLLDAATKMLGVMTIVGTWSLVFPFAMTGVLALLSLAVAMGLALAALGGLSKIPGVMDFVTSGGQLLGAIGSALGEFFGGFVGSAFAQIASTLPGIAEDLTAFMENASGFIEGAKGIDQSVIDGALNIAGAILALTGASLVEGIASFFGIETSWDELGNDLEAMGLAMVRFSEATADIDIESFSKMTQAAEQLIGLSKVLPNTEGLWGWIAGKQDIGEFGTKLADLAVGLTKFGTAAMKIPPAAYTAMLLAAQVLDPIVDMSNKLPNTEGAWGWIAGKQDIGEFGTKLADLAYGLTKFGTAAMSIPPAAYSAMLMAAKVLDPIVDLSNKLPNTEGAWGWIAGKQDIGEFGTKLADLATGLAAFGTAAMKIPADGYESMMRAAEALDPIVDLSNKLPNTEGAWGWIAGKQDIGEFGTKLADLATGLAEFANASKGIPSDGYDSMMKAAEVIDPLVDISKKLPNTEGAWGWLSGKQDLKEFGKNLSELGEGMASFASSIQGVDLAAISNVAPALEDLIDIAKENVDTSRLITLSDNFNDFADGVKSFIKSWGKVDTAGLDKAIEDVQTVNAKLTGLSASLSTGASSGFTAFVDSLKAMASEGVDGLIEAIKTKMSEYREALSNGLLDAIKSVEVSVGPDYKKSGEGLMDKLREGLLGKKTTFKDSVEEVADEGTEVIRRKRQPVVHEVEKTLSASTSKIDEYKSEFSNSGSNLVEGLIDGINSKKGDVGAATSGVGKIAIGKLNKALQIQSPSRLAEKSGQFFGQGFINGVSDFISISGKTAEEVGMNALEGLDKAINDTSALGLDGIDNTLTIRPVLDLTEIQNGTSELDRMMGRFNGYTIGGSAELAGAAYMSMGYRNSSSVNPMSEEFDKLSKSMDKLSSKNSVTQNNTFNISGNNPEEIAKEVSKILTREIKRGEDRWD